MAAHRRTPEAITKPLTVLNVERALFVALLLFCFVVGNYVNWILGGVLAFVAYVGAQLATRYDDCFLQVVLASWNFPEAFDPGKRDIFELTITGDTHVLEAPQWISKSIAA